ncbi:MAG: tetratricopeptide repeat protein [Thermoanaerobaculia bacterium]
MKTTHRALGALLGLCVAAAMLAGAQARLTGKVLDSAGNPLEGATVTVTTKNIASFKITLKTDKRGIYATIIGDATIPYHLRFEKEGYVPFEGDKKIGVGEAAGLDATLTKVSEAEAAARAAAPPSANELAAGTYNEGVDLLNAGNRTAAEAKFLEAVKTSPDLPAVWKALTYIAYDRKDWPKTVEYGLKATDLDLSLTNLYGMMAEAAQASGDKKGAAEYLAKYAEANPDTPEMLYNKGVEAYNHNKMKEAEEALGKAVAARPEYALAHFWLGMASINVKKNAAAREHFQKYLELEPKGSEAETAREMLSVLK